MREYDPHDWFWIVDGDKERFWSSAAARRSALASASLPECQRERP